MVDIELNKKLKELSKRIMCNDAIKFEVKYDNKKKNIYVKIPQNADDITVDFHKFINQSNMTNYITNILQKCIDPNDRSVYLSIPERNI